MADRYAFISKEKNGEEFDDGIEVDLVPENIFVDSFEFPDDDNLLDILISLKPDSLHDNFLNDSNVVINNNNNGTGSWVTVASFSTQSFPVGKFRIGFLCIFDFVAKNKNDRVEIEFLVDGAQTGKTNRFKSTVNNVNFDGLNINYFYYLNFATAQTHLIEVRARVLGNRNCSALFDETQVEIDKKG